MKESFFERAKADGKVFVKLVNLAGKVGKLKLDIRQKRQSRDRQLTAIGATIFDLNRKQGTLVGQDLVSAVGEDLYTVKKLDEEIASLEELITQARAQMKEKGIHEDELGD